MGGQNSISCEPESCWLEMGNQAGCTEATEEPHYLDNRGAGCSLLPFVNLPDLQVLIADARTVSLILDTHRGNRANPICANLRDESVVRFSLLQDTGRGPVTPRTMLFASDRLGHTINPAGFP